MDMGRRKTLAKTVNSGPPPWIPPFAPGFLSSSKYRSVSSPKPSPRVACCNNAWALHVWPFAICRVPFGDDKTCATTSRVSLEMASSKASFPPNPMLVAAASATARNIQSPLPGTLRIVKHFLVSSLPSLLSSSMTRNSSGSTQTPLGAYSNVERILLIEAGESEGSVLSFVDTVVKTFIKVVGASTSSPFVDFKLVSILALLLSPISGEVKDSAV
mmetsp:Transcript_42832/g.103583  ORF Transcript_42832/g.103583 Transcript_42832/m.103583 type:complete len:216 (-) Transcript_42832:61-708(-)